MGVLSGLEGVFSGPGRGLLTPEQRAQATKESLRTFGLSLLAQSGPPGGGRNAPSFLQALAAGTMAGRESYKQSGAEQRKAAATKDIEDILAGGFSGTNLANAYTRAVQAGDQDTARTLAGPLQTILASEDGTEPNLKSIERDNGDVVFFNPKTGEEVSTWHPPEGTDVRMSAEDKRLATSVVGQFMSNTNLLREIPQQVRRVYAPTNRIIRTYEDPKATEQEIDEVTYATLTAISAYARTIDPGSTVRSQELEGLIRQGDLKEQLETYLSQKLTGRMTYELARALQAEARAQLIAQAPVFNEIRKNYDNMLTAFGFDEGVIQQILPDPYNELYREIFDEQGRVSQNYIGFTPQERQKLGGPPANMSGRDNPLTQFIPEGG